MRIGELLIAVDLINAKQLSSGLEYARAKGLPIGRVLKLLKILDDKNLELALLGQRFIRSGLEPEIVVKTVKECIETGAQFDQVLKKHAAGVALQAAPDLVAVNVPGNVTAETKSPADLIKAGDIALNEDKLEDAERLYKLAIAKLENGADVIALADACSRLAAFYLLTDKWPESEALYQHALQLRTKKLGAEDASIARVYGDLADLFDVWDQHERSIEYALKACTVLHKHLPGAFDEFYGPLRKLTVFSKKLAQAPRRRMGELLTETGILTEQKLQGALQHAKQEGKPLGSVLKEDGYIAEQELQSVLSAQLLMKEGVLPEEIAVEALKVARKMNMPLRAVIDHFKLLAAATDDDTLAELVMEQDRLLAAENGLGVNHPDVGTIAFHLAEKYYQRNRLADAEVFLKRALAIDALTHALQVDLVGSACERLAQIYKATGRELLAAPLLMRALECLSKTGQSESERGSRILLMAAEVEMSQKNYMVALSFLRSVQALQDKRQEEVSLRIPVLEKLGACYMELDQVEQAEPILARAAELKKQSSS